MTENVEEINFNSVKNQINQKYIDLLENLNETLKKTGLNNEKHLISYEKNFVSFKKRDDEYKFNFIINNYLHILPYVVEHNLDFFLTQKPYLLKKTKKSKKKIPNKKSTHICPGNMLRYVIKGLKNSPKDGKVSDNNTLDEIFNNLTSLFELLSNEENNYLEDLKNYILETTKDKNILQKQKVVLDNFDIILNNKEEVQEISSSDDEDEKKDDKKEESKQEKLPFDESFMENSSIGQLAKEISEELNPDDLKDLENPSDLLGTLFGGGGANSKLSNIIGKVVSKVGDKIKDGKLDHNILGNEAKNIMSSFGGMENLAKGNMGDIFGNLFKNM